MSFSGGIEENTVSLDIEVQNTLDLMKALQNMWLRDVFMHFHKSG